MGININPELFLKHRLHLNEKGHILVSENAKSKELKIA